MLSLVLFILLVSPVLSTSNYVSKRLLFNGDQNVLTDFHRISALVDQLVKEKNETDAKLRSMERRTSQLETSLIQLQTKVGSSDGRSTYVRWGRTVCQGNGTELVYSGIAGGSWYGNSGGAANHVCLSKEPLWGHYDDAQNAGARIYGTEYQMSSASAFFGQNLYNNDAACAVCASPRSMTFMIPGRNKCTAGWTEEYHGYLVAGYRGHAKASEYICLDERPEDILGGSRDSDGNLLYMVEGICGSLACPPYVDGREITCVVCSK